MVKWEYKIEEECPVYSDDLVKKLNEFGQEGWEVCKTERQEEFWPVLYNIVYLKRMIE